MEIREGGLLRLDIHYQKGSLTSRSSSSPAPRPSLVGEGEGREEEGQGSEGVARLRGARPPRPSPARRF
eukprot:scaffold58308_cov32-Tisochrysis_lutea.AAC.1